MMRIAAIGWLVLAAACASKPKQYGNPVATMMDRTEAHRHRWAAAKQAEQQMFDHPERVKALKELVWRRGHAEEFSNYAVDQLLAINEQNAREFLSTAIVLIKDWATLHYVIDIAVERQWKDFTPALVRNYALRTPAYRDDERPERKAIAILNPGRTPEDVIIEVFADEAKSQSTTQRAAAWQLLNRLIADREELLQLLLRQEARDPLVSDLQAAARDLHVTADNIQTITWIQLLRTALYESFWNKAKAAVAKLDAEQRQGLELRHLPVLVHLTEHDSSIMQAGRAELLSRVRRYVLEQKHHLEGPTYDGPMDEHPQMLSAWTDQLCWADLATMHVLTRAMGNRQAVADWFKQADADVKDGSTEYGGLVVIGESGQPTPHLYKPTLRRHDLVYYPPKRMMIDAYTALAHYHFHAQKYKNRRYAGPGIGDVDRNAQRQQFSGLVLTFIDEDHLNVDYYQRPDTVVDLGTIRR